MLLITFEAGALDYKYRQLPDSTREELRMQASLLFQSNKVDTKVLQRSLDAGIPVALSFYNDNIENLNRLLNLCLQVQQRILVVSNNNIDLPAITNGQVVLINPSDFDHITLSAGQFSSHNEEPFTVKELLMVSLRDSIKEKELLYKIWETYGKLPNLISANKINADELGKTITWLNSKKKLFGVVKTEDLLLTDVSWKNYPKIKAYGYFCYPFNKDSIQLFSPFKAGYHFSPDIIFRAPGNEKFSKTFNAIEHKPDFGLSDHFSFNRKVKNKTRGNDNEILVNGVTFEDGERGVVAYFDSRAYIDAGLQSQNALKSDFSIVVWVKPTQLTANNSILGKGKNFVLKIHDGKLTFTMAGIKDYVSNFSHIPANEWTHAAMVYSKLNNYISFYINGELTEKIDMVADYSGTENSLMIGSNLWEEFFIGYIGEIRIWERELSNNEIVDHYHGYKNFSNLKFAAIGLIFVLGLFFILLRLRRKNISKDTYGFDQKNLFKLKKYNRNSDNLVQVSGERIICFGGLMVFNKAGDDISLRFSPKLKQLFILIYLYSHGEEDGINSKKLTDILWPGFTSTNAKNIRGTYMQNLRIVLSTCSEINLVFQDKKWKLNLTNECFDEYALVDNYLKTLEQSHTNKQLELILPELISILKKGRFLPNMEQSWLDSFIEKISNRIIEVSIELFNKLDQQENTTLLFDLAEVVSLHDHLNEPALRLKIFLLTQQGKLSLAQSAYNNFTKLYKELYQENYHTDFKSLISEEFTLN